MVIKEARFWGYKNLHGATKLSPGMNIIVAANGTGKTNFLEALNYLTTGSSFRSIPEEHIWPSHLLKQDQVVISTDVGDHKLQLHWSQNNRKKYLLNGKSTNLRKMREKLRTMVYAPNSIDLVIGSARERRQFVDGVISFLKPNYAATTKEYKRVLASRNKLLADSEPAATARMRPGDEVGSAAAGDWDQKGFWDKKLVELGAEIVAKRLEFLRALVPLCHEIASDIYNIAEVDIDFDYESKVYPVAAIRDGNPVQLAKIEENFTEKLRSSSWKELSAQRTLYGPHRDDVHLLLGSKAARYTASRGQQRLYGLIIYLASLKLVEAELGTQFVLLLDDLFSELDETHRVNTGDYIAQLAAEGQQVIVTAPAIEFLPSGYLENAHHLDITTLTSS